MNIMMVYVAGQSDSACYASEQDWYYYGGVGWDDECADTVNAVNVSLFDFTVITNNTNSH